MKMIEICGFFIQLEVFFYIYIKAFMLDMFDISARLTPQVTTIIYHHMKTYMLTKTISR